MFKIFDITLPDDYIHALGSDDLELLENEAETYAFQLEVELDELMWQNDSRVVGDRHFEPIAPSEYSYDQSLFPEEVAIDPSFSVKLGKAENTRSIIGATRAIAATARLERIRRGEG